jgi:ligand-binding sensor domain-containing protein/signal transduction histidine kinase
MFCRPFQIRLLTWVVLVSQAIALAASEADKRPSSSRFSIKSWTTEDGLPQHHIACLKQTRDGYLWIGTWSGLARFDGMRFTVYNKFNTPELVNDTINALTVDSDGTLWIGTKEGLVSYRDQRFQRLSGPDAFAGQNILRLAACRAGGMWIQAGGGVARLKGLQCSRIWVLEASAQSTVRSMNEGVDGWLNVFTDIAWFALPPEAVAMRTNFVAEPDAWSVLAGWPAELAGSAWAGTALGLRRLEQGTLKTVEAEELSHRGVSLIQQDRAGALWIGTQPAGLYRWDQKHCEAFDLGQGATVCIEQDLEGNLWVGNDQGLTRLTRTEARTYTVRDGLAGDNVLSVCEGNDGKVWVGTSSGLSCIRTGEVAPLGAKEPFPEFENRCVWPSVDGGVFIAKRGYGITQYQKGKFIFQASIPKAFGMVNALYEDHSGRLWLGTERGAFGFKSGQFDDPCLSVTNSLARDIRSVLEDREDTLWFGTRKQGLARFRAGTFNVFTKRDGLSDDSVWSLLEDGEGALWIGTDNGLTRYRNGKFFPFTRQHGLPENIINCVLQDDSGRLWLGGWHGIHWVQREKLDAIAESRALTAQFVTIGTADGMANPETNGGENQPAGWKAHDGRLWFPTLKGVVVIDPKDFPLAESAPPVVIEQVKADGVVVFGEASEEDSQESKGRAERSVVQPHPSRGTQDQSRHELPAGHGQVEFRFTANTFVDSERVPFRYRLRLQGADAAWREETGERTARFYDLRPGDYRFEVTAANHHKIWNPRPATFDFSLAPHFWQTSMFYVLCAGGVIGLAATMQGYRLRWQHRFLKLEEQRALANQRTRIARDLHDDLGTSLSGLALELDVVGREAQGDTRVAGHLGEAARRTRELAERMREVVWSVNPKCDTVSSLADFLEQQVGLVLRAHGVRVRLEFPEDIPALPLGADARHQLALSVREALTNVARHAQAAEVVISLAIESKSLVLKVQDNGRGFVPSQATGNGLGNMRSRLEQIGGKFECASDPASGTCLTFRLPLPAQQNEPA